jgi:hypothetical protein
MSALLSCALIFLQKAIHHIQNDDRYRFYPLYSVLLMLTVRVYYYWPWPGKLLVLFREYPWLISVNHIAEAGVLAMSLPLGIVGLLRRGWLPKLLSAYAIYYAAPMFIWNFSHYFWWNWSSLWMDFTWYAFDLPIAWIHQHVGSDVYARTSLYAMYLLALYLLLRTPAKSLAKRLWPIILRFEDRVIARYPFMERWKRPVL